MKKRLFSLFLAVTMVLSLIVIPAYAVESDTETAVVTDLSATTCGCGCGKKLSAVEWKAWTGEVASGHFYLTGDQTIAETINVISGESVVLDLRGYTITTSTRVRTFYINGYVGILDTVGGGRLSGRTVNDSGSSNGGLVEVEDNETPGSMFELYSGIVTPASDAGKPDNGGLIKLGTGATFRMRDGLLLNGVTASSKSGGAVFANDFATVEILGGSIVGCTAGSSGGSIYSSGTTILKNCTIIGGSAGTGGSNGSGGNINQNGGSLTVENCTIANGKSNTTNKYGGGNIGIVGNAKVNITDSKIYGGYALSNGGNLSLGYGTITIKNTEIYGGSCEGKGGNVSLPINSANATFDGCTIDGDMDNMIGTLTLKGATKISNNNGGLDLTESTKTVKATGLTSGAEVYVSGDKTLTGSLDYIKPALNCTLTASGTTLTVAPAADGVEAGYCPHCNAKTAWQPYGTANATHVYLTRDMDSFAEVTVSGDLCIDTRGFDITATGRAFTVANGGKLALIDSVGGSIFTGKGVAGENGGFILNNGTLLLQGGKYVYKSGNTVTDGGIVYSAGSLTAYGVVMDASAFANTAANGGAICLADGAGTATVMGGYIIGGSANYGGGFYSGYNNTVTITGAFFMKGKTAASGGNLSFSGISSKKKGSLQLSGCMVSGGEAAASGGNLYATYYATATVTDCYITGGTAENVGGNIAIASVTMPITSCYIIKGTAKGNGGGNINTATLSSNLTLTDCVVLYGAATGESGVGGNVRAQLGEAVSLDGGLIAYGTATASGGNLYTRCTVNIGTAAGQPVRVLRGTAGTCGGNLHVAKGDTVVNKAYFGGGTAPEGNDVYISEGSLTLRSGVTGHIYLNADSSLVTSTEQGKAISCITCQATEASFYMDGAYGNCGTMIKDETIYVATTAVVDKAGNTIWYSSNAEAVEACRDNQYVKLFTGDDLVLTKNLYVDINGQTVNVSGDYTLYGMDASGDGYEEPAGKVTLNGAVAAAVTDAPNGKTYISQDNGFHRLGMQITGVSIRPSADGMYYTAKWSCDNTLKGMIDTYGVVASTANMPGADFASEEENRWTTFTQNSFVSGQAKNGAVISGIMSETADDNDGRGETPVYAKAYITFNNGDTYVSRDNIGYSLQDVMENLDKLIMSKPIKYRKYTLTARSFYETWKDNGMASWNLTKIPKPADDGVIDVLMIGASFNSYFVQELYALGQAAGIDIRVCNLYYSGCPLEKHYNWWVGGKSNYQYYETFHDGRKLSPNVSLEWGLAQHEWDFISLTEGSTKILGADLTEQYFEDSRQYWQPLYDYLFEQFPDTQLLWQNSWASQVADHQKEGSALSTIEDQRDRTQVMEKYGNLICGYYNDGQTLLQCVPTCRAWQNVRDEGYDFLCCRLYKTNNVSGVAHGGDGYHDGDIGGGQYLNACIWFEIVTGKSVIGNSYVAEYDTTATLADSLLAQVKVEKTATGYKLTDALAAQLQEAAHRAVAATGFVVE